MGNTAQAYDNLVATLRSIATLRSVAAVLGWDERTQLPARGAELRSQQSSMLAKMVHEQFTSPRIGELLGELEGSEEAKDVHGDIGATVREVRRGYNRAIKLPTSLVEELARTSVLAEQAWVEARKQSQFDAFKPWLEKTVALKRQQAACYGFVSNPYDALLDDYEPGETAENIDRVFASLRQPLIDLVAKIMASGKRAPVELLHRNYPIADQQNLGRLAAEKMGFDFSAGRLDTTVHPFCSGIGPGDVRLTTRYNERDFADSFFSVLHETGHGLYEQGLPAEHFGTPLGDSISLGIHESQSRLWENFVGRTPAFWRHFFPLVGAEFPHAIAGVTEDQWLFAINHVQPSLIRTEADEVTYNLHIMLRFEMEQMLLKDELPVADVPAAWNAKMRQYLGIAPPDDAHGCLQDVHWSGGGIGYFPTYTLGNLYAAQFMEQARIDAPDLDDRIAAGNFAPLLSWLGEKIHHKGMRYRAGELVQEVTGKPLSAEPLLRHLEAKAARWYGV